VSSAATYIGIIQQKNADAAKRLGFPLQKREDGSWRCQISSDELSEDDVRKAKLRIILEAMTDEAI
jgi:hypothetical protein